MPHSMSCDRALYFTKLSVFLACTWPPSRNASKRDTIKYHIAWFISFLSASCLLLPLILSIIKYHGNLLIVAQTIGFMGAIGNLMFKMIVYRIHIERTQTSIHEMENFLKKAKPNEEIIVQSYIDRCWKLHGFMTFVNYLTAVIVVMTPIFVPEQPLPTTAVYPFSVECGIAMYLAYLHQSIAGFQCSSGVTIDYQAAFMMWFASARIEILADEIKRVTDIVNFECFVKKHRKLIAYAVNVSGTMRWIAFSSSMTCGLTAITSSLQLLSNEPPAVKMRFGPIALIAIVNLFICALSAESLISACNFLENSIYNSPWIDMPLNMMKNILFILRRSQRPVIVSIAGFLPILSLRSYASFLSATFSYFTTLRLVVTSHDEK